MAKLREPEGYRRSYEPYFEQIGSRLAHSTYDRSAFVFILIEHVYELEEAFGDNLVGFLARAVLALSDDAQLAQSAAETFREIKSSLDPEASAPREPAVQSPPDSPAKAIAQSPSVDPPAAPGRADGSTMAGLQAAQKAVSDLGLRTRMSIEMVLGRPGRESARQTLREIALLRSRLRRFDELLLEAESEIRGAIELLEES